MFIDYLQGLLRIGLVIRERERTSTQCKSSQALCSFASRTSLHGKVPEIWRLLKLLKEKNA